jgi:hypothetical protein
MSLKIKIPKVIQAKYVYSFIYTKGKTPTVNASMMTFGEKFYNTKYSNETKIPKASQARNVYRVHTNNSQTIRHQCHHDDIWFNIQRHNSMYLKTKVHTVSFCM